MNITFERPQYLWLLLFAVFVSIVVVLKARNVKKLANSFVNKDSQKLGFFSQQKIFIKLLIKGFLRVFAWCCLVLAISGISWGSVSTPVQKNGKACF